MISFRCLAFVAVAFLSFALPAWGQTAPKVATVYAITVKGNCYKVTPTPGGGATATFLESYQHAGRMKVVPRIATTTPNGSNARDVAFLVDHGSTGGVGAMQYVTNAKLFSDIAPGVNAAVDYVFATLNASGTTLTILHDKSRFSSSNIFKVPAGLVPDFHMVKGSKITITFLAAGRVSGKFSLNGIGLVGGTLANVSGTFSGKVTTGPLNP